MHLFQKSIDGKYRQLFVRLFVISLLTFRYFSTIVSHFGAGEAPFFTAPAPAPAPSKPFRRLRLRLRPKCVGSGGSGSGSVSGSASLMDTILRQCRSWHVARAKLGILWTTPKTLYLNNRTTAGPIGLRLCIQLGTQQTIHVCGSFLGCFSTCARTHPASISRKRLNRLR